MNLLELEPRGKYVFVGDTHGDLEASKKVIETYLKSGTKICFLGDYVDRGPDSRGNVDFLFKMRKNNPENVFLLQGNHERYDITPFSPADFWQSLSGQEFEKYSNLFRSLPYTISIGDVIALHGALPDINSIDEINSIEDNDSNWKAILWGDLQEGEPFGEDNYGRPQFGQTYFDNIMSRLNKKVLIRCHDPFASERMFDNRCLTIFTSCAYKRRKTVALCDFDENPEIKSIDNLVIETI